MQLRNNKKYPQRILIIGVIISLLLGGVGYGFAQYQEVSYLIEKAEDFQEQGEYKKAIEQLEEAKMKLLVDKFRVKEEKITSKIKTNRKQFQKNNDLKKENKKDSQEQEKTEEEKGTKVGGIISSDTTWTSNSGPYFVTKNILVKKEAELTIKPGTRIEFEKNLASPEDNYNIEVKGRLIAKGEKGKKIIFASKDSNKWGMIYFSDRTEEVNSSDKKENIINNCIIKHGGGDASDLMYSGDTLVEIGQNNSALIKNSIFKQSEAFSLKVRGYARIVNNEFQDGGVYLQGGDVYLSDNLLKEGLVISKRDNVAAEITRNDIIDHKEGAGISFSAGTYGGGEGHDLVINYNNIIGNKYGVLIGDYSEGKDLTLKHNNIYDNELAVKLNYKEKGFDFSNNWWGTTDSSDIDASIYDHQDDFNLGEVDYQPINNSKILDAGPEE